MNTTYWLNTIMENMYTNNESGFWIGLSSTRPDSDGSNVIEPSGNGYSRIEVGGFTTPDGGIVKNISAINFPISTGDWFPSNSKAAYWLLFDGSGSDANLLSWGNLDEPKTVESNTIVSIAENTLSVTLMNYISA